MWRPLTACRRIADASFPLAPAVMPAVAAITNFLKGVLAMKAGSVLIWAVSCCALSTAANAQTRDTGWEFGGDLIYQTSQDVDFEGGSDAAFEDDIGLSLSFGYR